ncbi:MAG: hypothetical protein BAA01_06235 [Bacillus thermozeamaize]|jgi:D-methionine transport system permease protein|uniref:ABC transmembrane type-1 domain-containing protein n=1 Tax=Bacillus thermozeamaize TaxID=230954 RepID=A0A1Y3PFW2_9BACI|nr:MAG: hypothetical protein BAA01_06235 [Bacillus thermozeamaize]
MFDNLLDKLPQLMEATLETIYMTGFSLLFSTMLGLPMGVLLVLSDKGGLMPNRFLNSVLGMIINVFRSIPFMILLILLIPVSRLVVGTAIGWQAATVSLVIAAAPFVARLIETALREVDRGVIEAAQAMGASNWQIIYKVLLPESLPSIVSGITVAAVTIVGYTAMAGAIGGGGLGHMAIRYGYQGYQPDITAVVTIILVLMVQLLQSLGDWLARRVDKR